MHRNAVSRQEPTDDQSDSVCYEARRFILEMMATGLRVVWLYTMGELQFPVFLLQTSFVVQMSLCLHRYN